MSMLEFPIRRYQFTLVAFLLLVAIGWFTFTTIPREEDPSFKLPGFQIAAIMPGADPKDLERLVAKPVEDRIAELDDVHDIETAIVDGVSFTVVEFESYTDAEKKYDEVTREINALRPTLPAELRELTVRKISPALVNIVEYALVSEDAPYRELEDLARDLKDTLKAVPGIRTAESWAFPPRELRIELDLKRIVTLGLNGYYNVRTDGVRPNRLSTSQVAFGGDLTAAYMGFSAMAAFLGKSSTYSYGGLPSDLSMGAMGSLRYFHEDTGLEAAVRFAWYEPSTAQTQDQVMEFVAMVGWKPFKLPFRVVGQFTHREEEQGVGYPNDSVDVMLHAVW